jgi:hypothetical protein
MGVFTLIRHGFAVPPSPVRGKAYRCDSRYYCAVGRVPVLEPSPLAGEGRLPLSGGDVERSETEGVGRLAAGQTDEGAVKGLLYFTNQSFLNQLLIPGKGKGPINHLFQSMNQ